MARLAGKVAIVTGSAVGIGRAIAVAYGREGAKVVVNYSKSRVEAEETAAQVEQAGGEPLLVQASVADDAQVRAMVARTLERFGQVDVLVCNAGITSHSPFDDLDALTGEVWDRLYDVNVKGTFYCARAVAGPMKQRGGGRIITFGSVAGLRPQGSSIAYCTSKAALIHMTKCLAKVLGPEIRVNAIAPGFIDQTRWNQGRANLDAMRSQIAQTTPLKRVGLPEDVVEVALFLASEATYVTGSVLVVDGGRELIQ